MHGLEMTLHNRRAPNSFMYASGSLMTLHNTRVPMRSDTHQNLVYGSRFNVFTILEHRTIHLILMHAGTHWHSRIMKRR